MERSRERRDSTDRWSNTEDDSNLSNNEESDEDIMDGRKIPFRYPQSERDKPRIHPKDTKLLPKPQPRKFIKKHIHTKPDKDNSKLWIIIIGLVGIFMGYAYSLFSPQTSHSKTPSVSRNLQEQQSIIYSSVSKIKDNFPNQNGQVWEEIIYGIYDIVLNPEQPSVIIFYATELDTINCLAKYVAQTSSFVLNGTQHLNFNPKDLDYNTEEIISKFKTDVSTQKAVVLENLLHVRPPAFRAFHNLFDRYNPLIKGVVYIATILMNNLSEPKPELFHLEKYITNLFSESIETETLRALVARITDSRILFINSEENMPQC